MTTDQKPGATLTQGSRLPSFAERIEERQVGPCRLLMLKTPVRSVVTWKASFKSHPNFSENEDLLQGLAVSLLDKGTQHRDRFEIAEELENRGAQVQFDSDGLHVDVSGRSLSHDVSDVLALAAEQLREPLFDAGEFEKSRSRMVASIQRSMESTGSQALGALTRRLYSPAHPNFTPEPSDRVTRLSELDVDRVRHYHERHFGSNELTFVVVGDFDEAQIENTVRSHFGDWKPHEIAGRFEAVPGEADPGRTEIPIPDKQNVDVRIGHVLDVLRDDADYIPIYLANYVLGGNFSARLMQVIRDEMGLTYGIRSGLYGISTEYSGHWQVAVTLSTENLERGVDATIGEVRRFVDEGLTEAELDDKKTTVVGSFKVGLATTGGLAGTLLKNAERGFDVGYLDRFPEEVQSVTLEHANEVVRSHIHPDRLHVAMAGMLPAVKRSEIEHSTTD